MGWPEFGCWVWSVACRPLRVACCMLLVACLHAATGAISFRMPARADAFVGMAVADAAVEQESLSHPARSHIIGHSTTTLLATAAAAHTVHSSCTASIAARQCWVAATTDQGRRHREGAAGGRDGGAPGRLVHRAAASLQSTPKRRRWALAARMVHCGCPRTFCSQLPHVSLT